MKKTVILSLVAVVAIAVAAMLAFAGGDKETAVDSTKQTAETTKTGASVCPLTGEVVGYKCPKSDKSAAKMAAGEGEAEAQWVMRTISVKGMTCAGCESAVSTALAEVPGVVEVVKVCHHSAQAMVKIDPTAAKDEALVTAVAGKGYDAEIIPAVAKTVEVGDKGEACPISARAICDKVCCGSGGVKQTSDEKTAAGTK